MTDYSKKSNDQLLKIYAKIRKNFIKTLEDIINLDNFEDVIKEQARRSMKNCGFF